MLIWKSVLSFREWLVDFLFPKKDRILHLESLSTEKIVEIMPPSTLEREEDEIWALFDYSHHLVKEVIWEIKYKGNTFLADKMGEILFDHLWTLLEERNIFEKFGTIRLVPVPISDKRRFERGWNQSELLAKAIKARDRSGRIKYLPRQLSKVIHTDSQTHTSGRKERLKNLQGTMVVTNPLSVKNHCVIVIDDVTTTGSTFAEARRALKIAGAKKIICFAVSH